MGDKILRGVAVNVLFSDGESPTGAKLSAINYQVVNALTKVERAIGDIWDESWPYVPTVESRLSGPYANNLAGGASFGAERPLDIVNLGRLIGPASNLNPHELATQSSSIVETIPSGVYEFQLRFPPATVSSFSGTGSVFTDSKATANLIVNAGDYCIDSSGKVNTFTVTSGGTVTYTITPSSWGQGTSYPGSSFNVIPDINQLDSGGAGCTISGPDGNGRYTVTLPTLTYAQWSYTGTTDQLQTSDPNRQQLALPKILVDNWTAGEEIPAGFLLLKNWTTGQTYDLATYYYNSSTTFKIGGVDLADAIAASDKFYTITVGTDITSSIDDLRRKLMQPNPRTWGGPLLPVTALISGLASAGASGPFVPSTNASNWAPQYLHRDGFRNGADTANANDGNIMRGPLVIGYEGDTAGTHSAGSGQTFALVFGWSPDAGGTYFSQIAQNSGNILQFFNNQDAGFDFNGGPIRSDEGFAGDPSVSGDVGIKFWRKSGTIDLYNVAGLSSVGSDTISISDLSGYTIYNFDIMIKEHGTTEWYRLPGRTADQSNFGKYDSAANEIVVAVVHDTDFSFNNASIQYRLVVQYY